LRILSEQLEKKHERSQEIARDAAIVAETYMSLLRGKGWVFLQLGLE